MLGWLPGDGQNQRTGEFGGTQSIASWRTMTTTTIPVVTMYRINAQQLIKFYGRPKEYVQGAKF